MVLFGAVKNSTVGIITIWVFSPAYPCVGVGPSPSSIYPYCREGCVFPGCFGGHCMMEKYAIKEKGQKCEGLGLGVCWLFRERGDEIGSWRKWMGKRKGFRNPRTCESHCIVFEKHIVLNFYDCTVCFWSTSRWLDHMSYYFNTHYRYKPFSKSSQGCGWN